MNQYDVLTFGEAMGMFIAKEVGDLSDVKDFTKELAGAETNVSIGLARLGYKVAWLSKVGLDPIGDYIIKELKTEKVDTALVKRDTERLTGFQLKEKVLSGDPFVQYYRKNTAASEMKTDDFPELNEVSANHYHLTGIPLALSDNVRELATFIINKAKSEGKTISFDPNLRPVLWKNKNIMVETLQHYASLADWVFPGIAEGKILTGYDQPKDIASYYLDKGAKLVVIKLGEKGAFVATPEKASLVPGYPVTQIVDTVGAGDGFAVGVMSGLFDGLSLDEAVRRGNAIGALAVMSPGDKDGLPTREQLKNFTQKRSVS